MLFHSSIFAVYSLAAGIPIALYLIFKSRKRDAALGSIYILRRVVQSQKTFSEWKRYLIITLRTLALIALVLAIMRPYSPWKASPSEEFPASPPSSHRVVLIDLSQSMSASFGARSRRESAAALCRRILANTGAPGRIDLVSMDGQSPPATFEDLPLTPDAVDRVIASLRPSPESANFEKSLRTASGLFRQHPSRNKELFILSDFSAKDLKESAALAAPTRLLEAEGVRVFPVSYENADAENFALIDLTPGVPGAVGDDLVLAGQPTVFSVTLGYYGSKASADTHLTIRTHDGEVLFEQAITLAPGEKTLEVPFTLAAGEQTLTATLGDDEYGVDNRLARSFRVRSELNVLVVQGISGARGFDNPREWLRLALRENSKTAMGGSESEKHAAQANAAAQTSSPVTVNVVNANPAQLNPSLFRDVDAMLLLDVDTVSPEALGAMVEYATRGGTIFLAPGPSARPDSFNLSFARLLPVDLAKPSREQIDPEVYQQVMVERASDRMLRELEDARGGNIGSARFYNWYTTVNGSERSDASPLLSLSEGDPLLMERPVGRGRVLLWTAGLGSQWHSLVVHAAYPLMFTRVLTDAAARTQFPLNLRPGDPLIRRLDGNSARLSTPDGKTHELAAVSADGRAFVRYDQTRQPGEYVVQLDPADERNVARYFVREDRGESDYRGVNDAARKQLQKVFRAEFFPDEPSLVRAVGSGYESGSITTCFAIAFFLLLACEAWLCRRLFT